jgi:hypothetical protein
MGLLRWSPGVQLSYGPADRVPESGFVSGAAAGVKGRSTRQSMVVTSAERSRRPRVWLRVARGYLDGDSPRTTIPAWRRPRSAEVVGIGAGQGPGEPDRRQGRVK